MADERDALLLSVPPVVSQGERFRKRLEAAGVKFTSRGNEATYSCSTCLDKGYTSREYLDKFGDRCTVAKPCEGSERTPCAIGLPIEGGLWARAMKPQRGQAEPSAALVERYKARLREHRHGRALMAAVDRALGRQEET